MMPIPSQCHFVPMYHIHGDIDLQLTSMKREQNQALLTLSLSMKYEGEMSTNEIAMTSLYTYVL